MKADVGARGRLVNESVVRSADRGRLRHRGKPIVLIIRDGWGINPGGKEKREENGDATLLARTPFHDQLYHTYPGGRLSASGLDVGLPEGQMGNSEVGHLNLGAGRIVYQDLTRINKAIAKGELGRNPTAQETFARARGHRLHFLGLVSDGGVPRHYKHLVSPGRRRRGSNRHSGSRNRWPTLQPGRGLSRILRCRIDEMRDRYRNRQIFRNDRDRRWDRTKRPGMRSCLAEGNGAVSRPRRSREQNWYG
jgi:2,3-bisphosphoglycerate-independent phosphoglycerate mutase